MKERELKIVPPEGYEIDRENSTLECVKFKKKLNRWRDNYDTIISGYFIFCGTVRSTSRINNFPTNHDVFATKKQAKSALAMAQISQIMANDERFGGVITDKEWKDNNSFKYVIDKYRGEIFCDIFIGNYHFLAFHTKEQRKLFLEENEDLVRDFLMID